MLYFSFQSSLCFITAYTTLPISKARPNPTQGNQKNVITISISPSSIVVPLGHRKQQTANQCQQQQTAAHQQQITG